MEIVHYEVKCWSRCEISMVRWNGKVEWWLEVNGDAGGRLVEMVTGVSQGGDWNYSGDGDWRQSQGGDWN